MGECEAYGRSLQLVNEAFLDLIKPVVRHQLLYKK